MSKAKSSGKSANFTEKYPFKSRKEEYCSLKKKMLDVGFVFEKEQVPHHQKKKENELKFIHPELIEKLEKNGFKVKPKKFYIKALSDKPESEIGLVTGRSSPLKTVPTFNPPNSIDSFDGNPAWTNTSTNQAIDVLLTSIRRYITNIYLSVKEEALFTKELLENHHDTTSKDIIEIIKSDEQEKVKKRLILARIGQGQFRKELIDIWNGCSISKYSDVSLLIASHIKPWCKCDNNEKVDSGNGLLLLPNYDKLFDRGYISFDENGKLLISKRLCNPEVFGLNDDMGIELKEDNRKYMKYHREEVFEDTVPSIV
ncbi:HNH endonuclease [Sphingobacterium multivorum]|uniref:HNH endonuclease n=1 Tax=Sphingobacterium multivorum TaxID=28454 RepID=UPI0028AD6217|nr:HNH endonuclease signature motif containing protein [Sphingobacterium multivorum]